ncbi:MAG: T9SS type A sorting domain-containing protein [Prolixibacteraceae bacterium]
MKKIFGLFLFLFLFHFESVAQEFAPVGASWYYSEWQFDGMPILENFLHIECEKDTLYEGQLCKKLVKNRRIWCNDRPETEYIFTRNDTVFFFDPNYSEFQVLYDFNAERGDGWDIKLVNYANEDPDTVHIVVDSTDIFVVNELSLKRLFVTYTINYAQGKFEPKYSSTIVEYIGDTDYLFNYLPFSAMTCDANGSGGLRCYSDSLIGEYSTHIANSCDEIVLWSSNEEYRDDLGLRISVLPSGNSLMLNQAGSVANQFKIFSINGKLLNWGVVIDRTIDIHQLSNGIFVLQLIKEDGKFISTRFMK